MADKFYYSIKVLAIAGPIVSAGEIIKRGLQLGGILLAMTICDGARLAVLKQFGVKI